MVKKRMTKRLGGSGERRDSAVSGVSLVQVDGRASTFNLPPSIIHLHRVNYNLL
jgi:hypothetical protein